MEKFINWENSSLEDILMIPDLKSREKILTLYQENIDEFAKNRVYRSVVNKNIGKSIEYIYQQILLAENKNQSMYLFPGDTIVIYPKQVVVLKKALKPFTCQISGGIIQKGKEYLYYRPFLENLTTGKKYVLQNPIRSEVVYENFYPDNISHFEELDWKLSHPFGIEENGFNYENLSKILGEGLYLRPFEKKKKRI